MKKFIRNNLLPLALIYLLSGIILRIVLWCLYVDVVEDKVGLVKLVQCILRGVLNDSIIAVYFSLVILILFSIIPKRIYDSKSFYYLWFVFSWLFIWGILFVFGAEIAFFEEFQSRFNLISVSYLLYPTEVIGNINQSYPMALIVIFTAITSFVTWFIFYKLGFWRLHNYQLSFKRKALNLGVLVVVIIIISNLISHNTLLPVGNRVESELSANGVSGFFRALKSFDLDYKQLYLTIKSEELSRHIKEQISLDGNDLSSPNSVWREFKTQERIIPELKNKNVVILLQESLGSSWIESFGGKKGLSPNLDKLFKESLVFTNLYATGTRTVRGLEAVTASFPPIPSESIVKRNGSENIRTIGSVFRENGYETSFLYGGYGAFDNMNHYFETNSFEVNDRMDIKNPKFGNIWGVSDEDLYRHTVEYLDQKSGSKSPQFLLVLSTSNHKPFTFPENSANIPVKRGGRDSGVRYADYAISKFLEEAKKHTWFDDTIFIIVADHDSRVYGKSYIPVEKYRIPMLVYSPKNITPQKVDSLMSQMDIGPTLFGLLGFNYSAPFLGQDILTKNYQGNSDKRYIPLNYNFEIGLFNGKKLLTLGLNDSIKAFEVSKVPDSRPEANNQAQMQINKEEENLVVSYFQSSYEAFTNNLMKEVNTPANSKMSN